MGAVVVGAVVVDVVGAAVVGAGVFVGFGAVVGVLVGAGVS